MLGMEPKSLNNTLSGHHTKEWKTILKYEIGQIEKLGTWVIPTKKSQHNTMQHCSQRKMWSGWQNYVVLGAHHSRWS